MPLPRSRALAALTAALALLASGCVPPDSTASTPTPDPSRAAASVTRAAEPTLPAPEAASSPTTTAVPPSGSATPEATIPPEPAPTSSSAPEAQGQARSGSALAALERLEVKGRAPKTGYDRAEFGPAWTDTDHNGCDTRNDVLARDLVDETFKPGTRDCVVLTGVLEDPYTGTQIHFTRGQGTSEAVQIDHVVALSDAWQKGAQGLSEAQRTALANDPLNLLAVDGPSNQKKSDADAASWLPPRSAARCPYVARQIAVKMTYTLWVTDGEKGAMERVLESCPDQELPDGGASPGAMSEPQAAPEPVRSSAAPAPAPKPAPTKAAPRLATTEPEAAEPDEAEAEESATDPRFSSCKKAKDAGYGPYASGSDPEYAWYRDGDDDGVVCE